MSGKHGRLTELERVRVGLLARLHRLSAAIGSLRQAVQRNGDLSVIDLTSLVSEWEEARDSVGAVFDALPFWLRSRLEGDSGAVSSVRRIGFRLRNPAAFGGLSDWWKWAYNDEGLRASDEYPCTRGTAGTPVIPNSDRLEALLQNAQFVPRWPSVATTIARVKTVFSSSRRAGREVLCPTRNDVGRHIRRYIRSHPSDWMPHGAGMEPEQFAIARRRGLLKCPWGLRDDVLRASIVESEEPFDVRDLVDRVLSDSLRGGKLGLFEYRRRGKKRPHVYWYEPNRSGKASGQTTEAMGIAGRLRSQRETRDQLKGRAETYVRRYGFHGVSSLARALDCWPSSLCNAIDSSVYLKARKAEFDDANPKKPREVPLTDTDLDTTPQERERELQELIAEQGREHQAEDRQARKRRYSQRRS